VRPDGATATSPGREPWVSRCDDCQPQRGDRNKTPLLSPRWGSPRRWLDNPGLAPWAIGCRPVGAQDPGLERMKPTDLRQFARTLRRSIVQGSHAAGVGHIGSALSVADILAALWGQVLRNPSTDHPDRDLFVLSKGHAALGLS